MPTSPGWNIVLALVAVIATVSVLVWAPPFVGFALAIAAATCWCIWIERHPSA